LQRAQMPVARWRGGLLLVRQRRATTPPAPARCELAPAINRSLRGPLLFRLTGIARELPQERLPKLQRAAPIMARASK
jgi:hypothetical protein